MKPYQSNESLQTPCPSGPWPVSPLEILQLGATKLALHLWRQGGGGSQNPSGPMARESVMTAHSQARAGHTDYFHANGSQFFPRRPALGQVGEGLSGQRICTNPFLALVKVCGSSPAQAIWKIIKWFQNVPNQLIVPRQLRLSEKPGESYEKYVPGSVTGCTGSPKQPPWLVRQ